MDLNSRDVEQPLKRAPGRKGSNLLSTILCKQCRPSALDFGPVSVPFSLFFHFIVSTGAVLVPTLPFFPHSPLSHRSTTKMQGRAECEGALEFHMQRINTATARKTYTGANTAALTYSITPGLRRCPLNPSSAVTDAGARAPHWTGAILDSSDTGSAAIRPPPSFLHWQVLTTPPHPTAFNRPMGPGLLLLCNLAGRCGNKVIKQSGEIAGSSNPVSPFFLLFFLLRSSAYLQTKQDLNGAQSPGPSTEPRSVYGSDRNQACDEVVYRTRRYTLGACCCPHIPAPINFSHILLNSAPSPCSVHMKHSIIDTSVLELNDGYYTVTC